MKGLCNCEQVSFEIEGKLPGMYQCHCILCQKQGGTSSNAATIVKQENFRWLSGEDQITVWQKKTGFSSHFCKVCGSPVPNAFRERYMWIPMGLIGDSYTRIVANIYTASAPNWANVQSADHQFADGPSSVEELLSVLDR